MTTIIYIPPNTNLPKDEQPAEQQNIINLINSINGNKNKLESDYDRKLTSIQNEFYNHRLDDTKLKVMLENEIKNKEAQYGVYYQNARLENIKKMQNINSLITDLRTQQSNLANNNTSYTTIQSLKGQNLAVSNVPNTKDYMIHVNNKCVSVNSRQNYSLEMCNNNRMSQRFTIESINDNASYLSQFNTRAPPTEIISYPYNLVKSKLTGLCLEENNGELTLNNCSSLAGQKWKGMSSNTKICRTN
jgi:hypothetical protein